MKNNGRLTIDNVREQIVGVGAQVPLLDGSHHQYVNLDNAASTPALRPVSDQPIGRPVRTPFSRHRLGRLASELILAEFQDFFYHLLKRPGCGACPGFSESGFAKLCSADSDHRIMGGAIWRWEQCAHPLTQGVRLHRTVAATA